MFRAFYQINLALFILLIPKLLDAHGSESHDSDHEVGTDNHSNPEKSIETSNAPPANLFKKSYQEINRKYQDKIESYFKKACYDCHSDQTRYPWYYKIPGIKQMIDNDIKEAKEHLIFTETFPFEGHGTPTEDLEEIKKAIEEAEMPPFKYRIMHSESKLSEDEKSEIYKWINESLQLLGNTPHNE